MKRRIRLVLGTMLTLVLGLSAAVIGSAGPAGAALPGTVTLNPSSGALSTAPMFTAATVDGACPAPYDAQVSVYVVKPDSTYAGSLATRISTGAPYSQAPFSVALPGTARSLGAVLGSSPADGSYHLEVRCLTSTGTSVPGNGFFLPIRVTGDTWQVEDTSQAEETALKVSADPARQAVVGTQYKVTAKVTPADATGVVEFIDASTFQSTRVPVRNGVAVLDATAGSAPRSFPYLVTFWPADAAAYRLSSESFGYYSVLQSGIEVFAEDGSVVEEGSKLARGQKVKVTAQGFRPGETVKVAIPGTRGEFAKATADSRGVVTAYDLTVPKRIWGGKHTLTLTGAGSCVKVTFSFAVSRW
ncbi:hypothetical protein O7599_13950 [Streptomyces sp. WMMC500]|uniref:hypothetical protein n=1 Tax=Streptomyces sp. WMMC500 TaxID=3015154 RepID=UPI00248AE943|nr:hypothetical protein [Streptomyces sp. WMMC500]WBB63554.1 hypothetical protein O7599_13950 [Streptomyces sp. WMMC500]